jgi:hypothetical protein
MPKPSLLLLAAVLFGCHASMDHMSSMRGYIEDTRHETNRHLGAAQAATTMQDMRDEMDIHRTGMTPMMSDMGMTIDSMMTLCHGRGLGEIRAMHGELDVEMTQHHSTMDASVELTAAQAEVERHAASMLVMMAGMDGAMGNMKCR